MKLSDSTRSSIVLTRSGLTEAERHILRQLDIGTFLECNLKQLKNSPLYTLKSLMTKRVNFVVIYVSASEQHLFGDVLQVLSFFIRTEKRLIIVDGQKKETVSVITTITGLLRITWASILGFISAGLSAVQALYFILFPRNRHSYKWKAGQVDVLYLKTDLWIGVRIGGSIGHVAGVMNALHRLKYSVLMLTFEKNPVIDEQVSQIVAQAPRGVGLPYENNLPRASSYLVHYAGALFADKKPVPLLYQRYSLNNLTGVRLARKYRTPFILEYNGSEVWGHKHWEKPLFFQRLSHLIEKVNLLNADLVVTVSEVLQREVINYGVPEERVLFYPNCVDPTIFDPDRFDLEERSAIRDRYSIPEGAFVCTFVGTFGRWHGAEVLAKAAAYLIESCREWCEHYKVHFFFVGDGLTAPEVRRILSGHIGSPFVSMIGMSPQDKTPGILAASDLFVSPHVGNPDGTPFFGSPTKLFEYMAMGKPIVASDLDQIGAICRGWQPGMEVPSSNKGSKFAVLVRPGDAMDLAQGIREVIDYTPEEQYRMGYEARTAVLSAFTWEHNVKKIIERLDALGIEGTTPQIWSHPTAGSTESVQND